MPIITISRGSLSGGERLAQELGARLGLKVISREVILEAARTYGVSEAELVKGLKSPPSLWERLRNSRDSYVLAIQAALAELVEGGDVVYHGLAGHLLLKELPQVLKLRLIAPLDYRIRAAMTALSCTREHAAEHIAALDHDRQQWVERMYGVEWTDPTLYDLVINLEHMEIDAAVELVTKLVEQPAFKITSESQQAVADFALTTRVRAALKLTSGFPDDVVQVNARRGVVHLSGGSYFESNRQAVVKFVKTLKGVKFVTPGDDTSAVDDTPATASELARDLMVPLTSYPHVHSWVPLREAMMALGASAVKLQDGHVIAPRFVLVLDEQERLVGVVSRRNLLRGLTPQFAAIDRARQSIGSLAPVASFSMPITLQWNSLFSAAAVQASWEPVRTVMEPIRGTVTLGDTLGAVVTTMIHHGIDLVPVLDGDKAVGVILMTDVFYTVGQHVLESGKARPTSP